MRTATDEHGIDWGSVGRKPDEYGINWASLNARKPATAPASKTPARTPSDYGTPAIRRWLSEPSLGAGRASAPERPPTKLGEAILRIFPPPPPEREEERPAQLVRNMAEDLLTVLGIPFRAAQEVVRAVGGPPAAEKMAKGAAIVLPGLPSKAVLEATREEAERQRRTGRLSEDEYREIRRITDIPISQATFKDAVHALAGVGSPKIMRWLRDSEWGQALAALGEVGAWLAIPKLAGKGLRGVKGAAGRVVGEGIRPRVRPEVVSEAARTATKRAGKTPVAEPVTGVTPQEAAYAALKGIKKLPQARRAAAVPEAASKLEAAGVRAEKARIMAERAAIPKTRLPPISEVPRVTLRELGEPTSFEVEVAQAARQRALGQGAATGETTPRAARLDASNLARRYGLPSADVDKALTRAIRGGVPPGEWALMQKVRTAVHDVFGERMADPQFGRPVGVTPGGVWRSAKRVGKTGLKVGGALSLAYSMAELKEKGPVPERALPEQVFAGGRLQDLVDFLMVPASAGWGVAESVTLGTPLGPTVMKAIRNRETPMDVAGWWGLPASLYADPSLLVPPAALARPVVAGGRAAARALNLGEKVEKLATRFGQLAIVKQGLNLWEDELLGPPVRKVSREMERLWHEKWDSLITNMGLARDRADELARGVRAVGKQFKTPASQVGEDVMALLEAPLTPGGRPRASRAGIGLARKRALDAIAGRAGREYAQAVQTLFRKAADLEDETGDLLAQTDVLARQVADSWKSVHLRRVMRGVEDIETHIKQLQLTDPAKASELRAWLANARMEAERMGGRLNLDAVARRKDTPKSVRDLLEMRDLIVRTRSGIAHGRELGERARIYEELAKEVALNEAEWRHLRSTNPRRAEEYLPFPKEAVDKLTGKPVFGALAGKWVPRHLWYLIHSSTPRPRKWYDAYVAGPVAFVKFGKTGLSSVAMGRNMLTNIVMADAVSDLSPYRFDVYWRAVRSVVKKDEIWQEARRAHVFTHDTSWRAELGEALDALEQTGASPLLKILSVPAKLVGGVSKAYGKAELWSKMAVYIAARDRGCPPSVAGEMADRAIFNYRKVPGMVNWFRRYGAFPFIVWPYKAIPTVARVIWERPAALSKYGKGLRALELMTPEETRVEEKRVLPEYLTEASVRAPGKEARYWQWGFIHPAQDIGELTLRETAMRLGTGVPNIIAALYGRNPVTGGPLYPAGTERVAPEEAAQRTWKAISESLLPAGTPPVPWFLPEGGPAWRAAFQTRARPTPSQPEGRERPAWERALAALGIKTVVVDVPGEQARRARELDAEIAAMNRLVEDWITKAGGFDKLSDEQKARIKEMEDRINRRANWLTGLPFGQYTHK